MAALRTSFPSEQAHQGPLTSPTLPSTIPHKNSTNSHLFHIQGTYSPFPSFSLSLSLRRPPPEAPDALHPEPRTFTSRNYPVDADL
ncbi:hypothetical protein E2C01_095376 [Portunus trituberculatus]|uniref:Uncharacterized protein n=1 Tax=Portunus trituberculatus TaxID=210409 RepID=A0A5B7JYJ5_PORTR|nr:hypothetical protein [Portunus trituberculatus]